MRASPRAVRNQPVPLGRGPAAEQAAAALLESTFVLAGSPDVMTAETVMLEAVLLAEFEAGGNTEVLAKLASAMSPGAVQPEVAEATAQLLAPADEHRAWADDTRTRLLLALAGAELAAGPAAAHSTS